MSRFDDIPRCPDCGMILTKLRNDEPNNQRQWCKDCQIVWLLPSNYFLTIQTKSDVK